MANSHELLTDLLRGVSRSFYLTLRVLPPGIRPQIGIAYLLARATDTIADTSLVPVATRLNTLEALGASIQDGRQPVPNFADWISTSAAPEASREVELLSRVEEVLEVLQTFPVQDQNEVRRVLAIIVQGQSLDLQRFELPHATAEGQVSPQQIRCLRTADELDEYTYLVAGCVGEFWTRICGLHVISLDPPDLDAQIRRGIRFGKGLQLVNILRDLPRDLRNGRCYLPESDLIPCGVQPTDLLDPTVEPRLRPAYDAWWTTARNHLQAGWEYTQALPRDPWRLRLACAWPLQIGFATLQRLQHAPVLDPGIRIKVPRREVRHLLFRSVLALFSRSQWDRLMN